MKTSKFFASIISILLPFFVNAQCMTLTFQTRDYNGSSVSCNGAADGSINVMAQGANGSLSYQWSNGSTNSRIVGLAAGSYTVTVSDNLGCSIVESISISEPLAITFNTATFATAYGHNLRCFGDANGFVTSTASGGTGKLDYLWSSGHTTETAGNLTAGNYSLTVNDENGCIATNSVVLTEPAALTIAATVISQPTVAGAADAEAQVMGAGGCGIKYAVEWSNGETTASVFDLSAGTYTVKIKDIYNCVAQTSVTVVDPLSNFIGTTPAGSNGSRTGSNGTLGQTAQLRPVMSQLVTPNTAGFNSTFVIKNIENFQDTELTIYNMMGQELASYKNYSNEWNGVNTNNDELVNGTYVAVLKYKVDGVANTMTTQVVVAR